MNRSATSISLVGRHRNPASPTGFAGRGLHMVIGLVVGAVVLAAPAAAYWGSTGSGIGTATTASLAPPTGVTVAPNSLPNVAVTWTASIASPSPTGYFLTRTSAGVSVPACGSSPVSLVLGTACTDASAPSGTYTYQVTAVYRSWTASSSPSGSVVVWTPTKVVFTTQPTSTVAGLSIAPTIAVSVENVSGSAISIPNVSVTVAIGINPGSAVLSGTLTELTNTSGVAAFPGLSIAGAGAGYTLTASSPALSSATSSPFTISAAAAARFAITSLALSGAASAAAALGPIAVTAQDAFGNAVTAPTGGIVVALASTSGGTHIFSATVNGTPTTSVSIPANSSTVTFFYGDTKAGTPTLTGSGSLTSASQTQTISAGAAAMLVFGQQPTNTVKGHAITPTTTAQVEDQYGNVTPSTAVVSIAIGNNAGGLLPGALYGTTSVAARVGVASFAGISIDGLVLTVGGNGNGYTLKVTSTGLTSATSNAFNIS